MDYRAIWNKAMLTTLGLVVMGTGFFFDYLKSYFEFNFNFPNWGFIVGSGLIILGSVWYIVDRLRGK